MKKAIKIILLITGSLVGLVILFALYVLLSVSRFSEVDDQEILAFLDKPIPENNAWEDMVVLRNIIYVSDKDDDAIVGHLYKNKPMSNDALEKLFARNQKALPVLEKMLAAGQVVAPKKDLTIDEIFEFETFSKQIKLARLLVLRAKQARENKNFSDAFKDIHITLKFATLSQSSREGLISVMIGSAIQSIATTELFLLIYDENLPACKTFELTRSLDKLSLTKERIKEAFAYEYWHSKNMAKQCSELDCDIDDICKKFDGFTKIMIAYPPFMRCVQQGRADVFLHTIKQADNPLSETIKFTPDNFPGSPAWFGYKIIFYTGYLYAYNDYILKVAESDTKIHAANIVSALRCYKEKTGKLPDALDELVPNYLKAVPDDPFDNQQMRYNKEKGYIYSIGWNLEDDGGHIDSNMINNRENPTFPVEPPPKPEIKKCPDKQDEQEQDEPK